MLTWEQGSLVCLKRFLSLAGHHYRLNGHEFEQAPGVGDGRGGLVCCSPWGRKESDTTERLNGFLLSPTHGDIDGAKEIDTK